MLDMLNSKTDRGPTQGLSGNRGFNAINLTDSKTTPSQEPFRYEVTRCQAISEPSASTVDSSLHMSYCCQVPGNRLLISGGGHTGFDVLAMRRNFPRADLSQLGSQTDIACLDDVEIQLFRSAALRQIISVLTQTVQHCTVTWA